jgi:hypothetical protein
MARKLLIARIGAGSITVALCAALPGCNLAIRPNDCFGDPSSRGMSSVECPKDGDASADSARDTMSDVAHDTVDAPAADTVADRP